MATSVHGIHHVTAIAGNPQENLNFYSGVLGLRLVKKSVNQDVIDTYHLFYADSAGSPGTDLTFFPWPDMEPARLGVGFTVEVPFAIPQGSLAYWQARLPAAGVPTGPLETRFGETVLPFRDPSNGDVDHWRTSARKLAISLSPPSVPYDSGWNWMP